MVTVRTPFRISFFGGGTDYPAWYRRNGGGVLSTTIDKYCYVTCRPLLPFHRQRFILKQSSIEGSQGTCEVQQYPSAAESLRMMGFEGCLEVDHRSDLPVTSGLGSSSAFTVGLLHALHMLRGNGVTKQSLAEQAIFVEQELTRETVGSQDQVAAAFGGFNHIVFAEDPPFAVKDPLVPKARLEALQSHLLLYFTGVRRTTLDIAGEQVRRIPDTQTELRLLTDLLDEALAVLRSGASLESFGLLLHEHWQLKKRLSSRISSPEIDAIYSAAGRSGALGGKLLGAGGGGFLLLFVPPNRQKQVQQRLTSLLRVPFRFEGQGSQIFCQGWPALPDNHDEVFEIRQGIR